MAEYTRPNTAQAFAENFQQIKPSMSDTEAYYESSRCLFCYDAPCVHACPSGIDIPLFIRQINAKNNTAAAKTIYDANYFGHACGKVCPTEVLCEGACVYNHSDVKPIEIGRLQAYATKCTLDNETVLYAPTASIGKKVAIIGAGPAGIGCACELRLHGVEVDVFEAKDKPSGLTVYGVAPYKITNEEVLQEVDFLEKQFGFRVFYSQKIVSDTDIQRLQQAYDAIFLGIGLGDTSTLGIPGEDLPEVLGAVEWIEELRMQQHQIHVPEKVVVLGAGNTAMDAASESARMGAANVLLAYRRSREEMGAYDFEYDLAKGAGVRGLFNVAPVAIEHNDGKVTGVRFVRTHTVQGRVENIAGSTFIEPCDRVVKATGQSKQTDLPNRLDVACAPNGTILVNADFQTAVPHIFAAGDAVSGGQEVVNAVANGKKAAQAMLRLVLG